MVTFKHYSFIGSFRTVFMNTEAALNNKNIKGGKNDIISLVLLAV